jgi:NADH-quinone oxidoreductase subunit L
MDVQTLYLVVPLAPLLGAIVVGLFGPKLGRAASHWLCILGVAIALAASYFIWADVRAGHVFNGDVYTWLQSGTSRFRSAS